MLKKVDCVAIAFSDIKLPTALPESLLCQWMSWADSINEATGLRREAYLAGINDTESQIDGSNLLIRTANGGRFELVGGMKDYRFLAVRYNTTREASQWPNQPNDLITVTVVDPKPWVFMDEREMLAACVIRDLRYSENMAQKQLAVVLWFQLTQWSYADADGSYLYASHNTMADCLGLSQSQVGKILRPLRQALRTEEHDTGIVTNDS